MAQNVTGMILGAPTFCLRRSHPSRPKLSLRLPLFLLDLMFIRGAEGDHGYKEQGLILQGGFSMNIVIERAGAQAPSVEFVEHKGIGHPDTLCDALAERLSIALSRLYLERFGRILHHNVDKALLRGGQARPAFGGGEVIAPIEIYLCGRAVTEVGRQLLALNELIAEGRRWCMRAWPTSAL